MYTFFINNTAISFQRKSTIIKVLESKIFPFISVSNLTEHLSVLSKQVENDTIIYECENPDKILEELISQLGIIEAGGGVVENDNHEYLFIYRRNKWDLPKGKLDKGETIDACALREVEEECGISNIHIIKSIGPTYHFFIPKKKNTYTVKRTMWYHMQFDGYEIPVPQAEEGITDIKWFSKTNLNTPLENTYAMVKSIISNLK